MAIPAVGLVFTPELSPLLREAGELISMVEIEPQALWRRGESAESIRLDLDAFESVLDLGKRRTLHSAGIPVGGSVTSSPALLRALRESVRLLQPEWMSGHLSFNRVPCDTGSSFAGHLLPPPQTRAGVAIAARNLLALHVEVGIPVAFETGANYLQPGSGEMPDGDFFAAVARASGCGIILDLHSLWVNQQNGRQSVGDVIARLPPDQVWEIHVAGGSTLEGHYLDSHDGLVPPEVMSELATCITSFPNLRAVVFEILPRHVERAGIGAIRSQLESIAGICNACQCASGRPVVLPPERPQCGATEVAEVASWESKLAADIHERMARVAIYHRLISEARAGAIALCLRHSLSMLFLSVGARATERLVLEYIHSSEPRRYPEDEALRFAEYLRARLSHVPDLDDALRFECSVLETARWVSNLESAVDSLEQKQIAAQA